MAPRTAPHRPRPHFARGGGYIVNPYVTTLVGPYGDIDNNSANQVYKRYLEWHTAKYGVTKKPLSFAKWMDWAKSSGINLNFAADGKQQVAEKSEQKPEVKKLPIGKYMLIGFAVVGLLALVVSSSSGE